MTETAKPINIFPFWLDKFCLQLTYLLTYSIHSIYSVTILFPGEFQFLWSIVTRSRRRLNVGCGLRPSTPQKPPINSFQDLRISNSSSPTGRTSALRSSSPPRPTFPPWIWRMLWKKKPRTSWERSTANTSCRSVGKVWLGSEENGANTFNRIVPILPGAYRRFSTGVLLV